MAFIPWIPPSPLLPKSYPTTFFRDQEYEGRYVICTMMSLVGRRRNIFRVSTVCPQVLVWWVALLDCVYAQWVGVEVSVCFSRLGAAVKLQSTVSLSNWRKQLFQQTGDYWGDISPSRNLIILRYKKQKKSRSMSVSQRSSTTRQTQQHQCQIRESQKTRTMGQKLKKGSTDIFNTPF
jgi:hypothetical protein